MIAELDNAPAPWVINGGTDDTPAPLPTDEQIASLLQENERLQEKVTRLKAQNKAKSIPVRSSCGRKSS